MGSGDGGGDGGGGYKGKAERFYLPALPMPVAVICCIFNFLVPGFGSIIAGFGQLCCSRNEDMDAAPRCLSFVINVGIGLLQFITTIFFFIGWFWSCIWGGFYLVTSAEYYHGNREGDTDRVNPAAIVQQPTVQYVYNNPAQTTGRPDLIIIRPPTYPGAPSRRNGGQRSSKTTSGHAQQVLPPSYEECAYDNPPAYPGPPLSDSKN